MAQYTPNFNLYEPDSSDDFADFRTEFNNNMDIIDQNLGGGGGSGGHTIYDKDGNALAQESGLQFTGNVNVSDDSVNGRTVVDILGGGGAVYGAFIDTTRIIASGNIPQGSSTYTATEDCALLFTILSDSNNSAKIEIDGVKAWEQYDQNGINSFANFLLVRSGQTVTFTQSYSSNGNYKAYGLTQGTNGIFAPVIYSDNERVIGVWRDNKPLYQKTCIFNPPFSAGNNTFNLDLSSECVIKTYSLFMHDKASSPITIGQGDELKMINIGYNSGVNRAVVWIASGTLPYLNNGQIWITVQYTKTTDVAGSGNWNTDGVPTHHYSTTEQVVGTWLGKPLYQRTWDIPTITVSNVGAWISTSIDASVMASLVDVKTSDNNVVWSGISAVIDGGIIKLINTTSQANLGVSKITLQYTKTTD